MCLEMSQSLDGATYFADNIGKCASTKRLHDNFTRSQNSQCAKIPNAIKPNLFHFFSSFNHKFAFYCALNYLT